jgi:hypothetical protein
MLLTISIDVGPDGPPGSNSQHHTKDLAGSAVQIHPPRVNCPAKRTDGQALSKKLKLKMSFHKKRGKCAEFAAHTAFSARLGEISCLFSLAVEFFTRFQGRSFQLMYLGCKALRLSIVV